MKFVKKIFSLLLCFIICVCISTSVFAATDTATINISNIDALPGDTVNVNIEITNNPGIMAMAFCITYDNTVLEYKNYSKGYLSSYTVKNHSDKGHVSFVNVENDDVATNGTILSLTFMVKNDAKAGKSIISLANSNRDKHGTRLHNSFSNSNQQFIIPAVMSGSVNIAENCKTSGHSYGEWSVVYPADCTTAGLKTRLCSRCNTQNEEKIPAAHDFEADWTVDKAATPQEDGEMSRHCTKCDQTTDKITFKYEEIGGDNNTSSNASSSSLPTDSSSNKPDENPSNESLLQPDSSSPINSSGNVPSNTSSNDTYCEAPTINNIVGEKIPLEKAEKFENFQHTIPPENSNKTEGGLSDNKSSEQSQNNSYLTTGPTTSNDSTDDNHVDSYFATTGGIVTIVLCLLLSIGILALGILIIIRNKNTNK